MPGATWLMSSSLEQASLLDVRPVDASRGEGHEDAENRGPQATRRCVAITILGGIHLYGLPADAGDNETELYRIVARDRALKGRANPWNHHISVAQDSRSPCRA